MFPLVVWAGGFVVIFSETVIFHNILENFYTNRTESLSIVVSMTLIFLEN